MSALLLSLSAVLLLVRPWSSGSGEEDDASRTFCWGILTSSDVAPLVEGEPHSSTVTPLDRDGPLSCSVWSAEDDLTPLVKMRLGDFEREWPYGTRTNWGNQNQYLSYAPIGNGVNGYTSDRSQAAVWLPDSCRPAARTEGDPAQLTLRASSPDSLGETRLWSLLSRVLLKSAAALTKKLGCGEEGFLTAADRVSSGDVRVGIEEGSLSAPGSTCRLGSFDPFDDRSARAGQVQRIAEDGYRAWSCLIGERSSKYIAFSVTSHPQLLREYRDRGDGSRDVPPLPYATTVRGCDGADHLIQLEYPDGDLRELSDRSRARAKKVAEMFKAPEVIFKDFTSAMKSELGCGR